MTRVIEKREVEVISCDFCGEETKHSEKCVLAERRGVRKKEVRPILLLTWERSIITMLDFEG